MRRDRTGRWYPTEESPGHGVRCSKCKQELDEFDSSFHWHPNSLFEVGDRVLVVGTHPWRGETGRIIERFQIEGLHWNVQLDNGMRAGASERFLRKVDE